MIKILPIILSTFLTVQGVQVQPPKHKVEPPTDEQVAELYVGLLNFIHICKDTVKFNGEEPLKLLATIDEGLSSHIEDEDAKKELLQKVFKDYVATITQFKINHPDVEKEEWCKLQQFVWSANGYENLFVKEERHGAPELKRIPDKEEKK